jgi:mono/diheme cytochrome c family protein
MCHAADGSGSSPAGKAMKAVPFSSPDLVKASDAELIASTTNGKGKMPAFSGKLTATQIKDVVAYIRTLQK